MAGHVGLKGYLKIGTLRIADASRVVLNFRKTRIICLCRRKIDGAATATKATTEFSMKAVTPYCRPGWSPT
jgi:hypothetical protein